MLKVYFNELVCLSACFCVPTKVGIFFHIFLVPDIFPSKFWDFTGFHADFTTSKPSVEPKKADNVLKYDGIGVSTVRTFTLAGCTTGPSFW